MSDTSTGTTDFGSKKKPTLPKKGTSGTSTRESSSKESTTKTSNSSGSTSTTTNTFINNMTRSSGNSTSGPRLSDSECTLALRGTILTIRWTGGTGTAKAVTVNLNLYVAYTDGGLHWVSRGAGGFRSTSEEKSIRLGEGAVLVASCREGSSGSYQDVQLDLNAVAKMAIKAPTVYLPFTDLSKLNGNGT